MFRLILKHLRFNSENLLHLFILSVFIGNPSSTSLICQSIDRKEISTEEANDLLKCSSFLTPFYIISFLFVFGLKVALIVLATHILSNFIIAVFLNRKNNKTKIKNSEIRFSFEDVLKSVNTVIYLLLMVSGTMVLAGILSYSITTFLDFFNIHSLFLKLILTNIEVSLGLNTLIEISLNEFTKILLICFLISFGGFSLHLQVINIISDYHLKYLGFLKYRIIQGIISIIIFTMIYIIFIYLI